MVDTPNLRVKISADIAEIKSALVSLQSQLKGVGNAGRAGGHDAAEGLGGLGNIADEVGRKVRAFIDLLVVDKLAEFAHAALETAESIGKISQKTGATTEELSAMRVAVHGQAEEFDKLTGGITRLAGVQDKAASGNKEAAKTFERVGISLADIKSKNPGDLFLEIANKLGNMEAGAKRAALAQQLFGKEGADLIPVMRELANGGFEEARKKAADFGVLLSQGMVDDAEQTKNAIGDLKLQAEGTANSFLSKVLPAIQDTLKGIREATQTDGIGAGEILGQAFAGIVKTITGLFELAGSLIAGVVASASTSADAVVDIRDRLLDFDVKGAVQRYKTYVDQVAAIRGKFIADAKATGSSIFDAFAGNTPAPGKPDPNRAGGGGTDGADPEGDTKKAVKGIVDQAQLAADAISHELEVLKQNFDDGLLSIDAYFARKLELQRQSIDAQIEQQKAEAATATSSDQQSRALTKIVELEKQREQLGPAVEREKKKAVDDLNKSLDQLKIRMLTLNGDTAAATRLQLDDEFKGLIQRLQAEGRDAELAMLNGFLDASVVKAQVDEFEQRAQKILQTLHTAETSIASQGQVGALSPNETENQLGAEREKALDKLTQLRAAVEAYYNATKDPSVLQFLQELSGEIGQVQAAQDQWRQQAQQLATDSAFNFLDKFATGGIRSIKDLKAAFADLVLSFFQGLAKMAAQALAQRAIFALFGAFGGGPAAATNFGIPAQGSGLLSAFVHHAGGIAGLGTTTRRVNPALWGNAPRYHGGGLAGDEVAAILRKGEEVVTEDNPRHIRNQGRGGSVPQHAIVVFGEDQLADALAGTAGEKTWILHAKNNPGTR